MVVCPHIFYKQITNIAREIFSEVVNLHQACESCDIFRKSNTQGKRVLKAEKNLNETAIDTRACLFAPRNNILVLVKGIHTVYRTGKVNGSVM